MKILTFKRLLGLAAIGGAVQYARKHGGFQNAWTELKGKARDFGKELSGKPAQASKLDEVGGDFGTSGGIGSRSFERGIGSSYSGPTGTGYGGGGTRNDGGGLR